MEPEVVIAGDAIARLAANAPAQTLVVMDANTREAAGQRVAEMLGGACVYVFDQRDELHPGLEEAARVLAHLDPGTVPIAVGSGVITDIVRYAAHASDREFVSVPTAASMDGYSSAVAAMQVEGVKVTYPARAPVAIYADPGVLAAAPAVLTTAGIGDLLGKATAGVDWLAAHLLYGEDYDSKIAGDTSSAMLRVAGSVEPLLAGEPTAQRQLIDCLIQSGLSIQRFGNSRPASGCEHHFSHFWDLLAARGLRQHSSHGLQVGYATGFCMKLQRFAYADPAPVPVHPQATEDPLGIDALHWLGEPTDEILAAVERKQNQVSGIPDGWPANGGRWDEVRRALASAMAPFDVVSHSLSQAGFPAGPGFLGLDRVTLRATIQHATRVRDRYTVIDFLEGQRRLDIAAEAVLPRHPGGAHRGD